MEAVYELVLRGGDERVVLADELIDVGDAVAIDNEIWLVLSQAEPESTIGRARFECRRALKLRLQAEELIAYAKELEVKITRTRATRERG
jgi:hypothetical protein